MFDRNNTRRPFLPIGCSALIILVGAILALTPIIEIIAQILGYMLILLGIILLTFNLVKKLFL
ncbi:MAG: hypothetical protein CL884_00860 [Dehalococcoidia bacterium]|jgi:hypothetical protein|nr:hypothetical protein [Dehalococcoidia bacterium]MQG07741.1 hypothetical protein [SAR202 cluster bacterium]CAI8368280.1 MAG: Uncharacterised protein [Chloroflexota bacterium]MCH2529206.1 hypothetical protein [Dehalococcoidia bacterium]MQG25682.1 hypothetical protein [SAR202 cluster bacterium]